MIGIKSMTAACVAALLATATAAAGQTPKPPGAPGKLCVNSKCSAAAQAAANGKVKWNPGHYMASNTVLYSGSTTSNIQNELNDLALGTNVVGYRVFITWGALELAQGQYNFAVLDSVLQALKSRYRTQMHLVVALMPMSFVGSMHAGGDGRVIPTYIQQNSAYGPSPVPGSYGWWGQSSNGVSTGKYCAALWRPAVMQRYIALLQAMGAHYDNDPNFEGVMFQEDSEAPGDATNYNPKAPDYSANAMGTQYQALMSASVAAFPQTSVIMENTWGIGTITQTQNLEVWMVNNRIAPGSADTLGQSAFVQFANNNAQVLNYGMAAYTGIGTTGTPYTGGDLRQQARAMMDVEGFDIAGNYYARFGGPYSPQDVLNALNLTYKASHAFWTHFDGTEIVRGGAGPVSSQAPQVKWTNLVPFLNANPLTNTSYPPNYP